MSEENSIRKLSFGSKVIAYELSYQDRKTLGIRVHPDCTVKVTAPVMTPDDTLEEKLKKKAPWILKQQQDFLSYHPITPPRQYVNGETHLYLGRQYRLRVEPAQTDEVKLYRGRLILFVKEKNKPEKVLSAWYREKACHHFNITLLNVFPLFKKYKIEVPPLQVHYMPTRWGSCTPKGKVILNPELIKAPKGSIEYVIIHELCHLVHHNHTKAFFELQDRMMPDWRKWKIRLERLFV